jgi:hypothetical protein
MTVPLLVVDGANVVGSVPDGWWRDRAGAAIRLRDRLVPITSAGLPDLLGPPGPAGLPGPVDVLLVVEGQARDIPETSGVRLERAPASGDDAIVGAVESAGDGRRVVVVTADRELRRRVTALGAEVIGPSNLPR